MKRFRPSFTSFQQGGAPAGDGWALAGSSVGDHFEDVVAAGVQRMQLEVEDAGIADQLDLQQAVSASHLCWADTGVTQLRLHPNPHPLNTSATSSHPHQQRFPRESRRSQVESVSYSSRGRYNPPNPPH